jgi:hypothetical protein
VVVDDLDLMRVAVPPLETDPPLVVDPNAVLAHPLPRELLEPIPGWYSKVLQGVGGIEHYEFSQRNSLQTSQKPPCTFTLEDPSRFGTPKAPDHRQSITLLVNNVKRYGCVIPTAAPVDLFAPSVEGKPQRPLGAT